MAILEKKISFSGNTSISIRYDDVANTITFSGTNGSDPITISVDSGGENTQGGNIIGNINTQADLMELLNSKLSITGDISNTLGINSDIQNAINNIQPGDPITGFSQEFDASTQILSSFISTYESTGSASSFINISETGGNNSSVSISSLDSRTVVSSIQDASSVQLIIDTTGITGCSVTLPNKAYYTNDTSNLDFNNPFDIVYEDDGLTWHYTQHTTLYPTLTNPSVSVSNTNPNINSMYGGNTTQTFSQTCTTSFDRGSINPQYSASEPYRSGPGTFSTGSNGETISSLTRTYEGNDNNDLYWSGVSATGNYTQGPQPYDSDGNIYSTPLPSGSVTSNSTNSYSSIKTLPYIYGVENSTEESGLINGTTSIIDVSLPEETSNYKQIICMPYSSIDSKFGGGISGIQQGNPLFSTGDDQPMSEYSVYQSSIQFSDNNTYDIIVIKYVGAQIGERTLRITKGGSI